MGTLRILLVDDHPVVRAGLRAMLTEFEDFSVAAEAADGDAAVRELTRLRALGERVDVVLMDLQMGAGMDGVTATAAIRKLDSAALLMSRISSPETALTPREVQLLELLATGLTNRAIARQLFISEATVKTHLVHIFGKLGVDNRTSAIALAAQRRIIRAPGT